MSKRFMLTAPEAKIEMQAHLSFRKGQQFPLCIWVDKGTREQSWRLPEFTEQLRGFTRQLPTETSLLVSLSLPDGLQHRKQDAI